LDVCQREPLESVWSSLRRKSQTNSDYKYAYEYLEALLNKVDFLKPFEMFSYVLDVLDGRRLLAQRLGDEVHEPLNEFLQIALNFEQTHTPSLQSFLHWLEEGKTEIKRDLDQEVNAVRILTVHGAKGLQAPIVFLPDTTQVPQARSQIFTHSHNDEDVLLWSESSSKDNALLKQLRQQEEQERYSEYMRLLYVALTRAEDELYIAGYESGKKVSDRSWYSLIKGALEKGAHVDGGVLYLTSEQEAPVKNSDNSTEVVVELFPDYLKGSPENSDDAVSRYQASSFEEDAQPHYYSDSNYGIERGKLIHSLLELLPGVEKEERYGYALKVAQSYREFFEPKQLDLMIKESISLLDNPDLSELFSTSSFAELPIFGKIDGALFSGQIDCLVMKEKELWVVDYKTQTSPPEEVDEVPRSYWYQMAIYRHLLKPLYPQHVVRCFLLWTYNAKLMELPLGDLDKIAVSKLEKHPNSTYDN
jgi:ATP-dependent helicase/nuclease subunit A